MSSSGSEEKEQGMSGGMVAVIIFVIVALIVWGLPMVSNHIGTLPPWKWIMGARRDVPFSGFGALNYF